MTGATVAEKRCWRCGQKFGCGAAGDGPCWCAALPPVPLEPARDCLCPTCLHSAASGRDQTR